MEERVLRRIEQLVEAAESRFPATLGEEWKGLGPVEKPPPPRSRAEQIEPERVEERYPPRSRVERIDPERMEERYTLRSRLERIEPERMEERYTPRSRLARIETERERTPAPRAAALLLSPALPVVRRSEIAGLLRSRKTLRQAILLQEILGPPKALRDRDSADPFGS